MYMYTHILIHVPTYRAGIGGAGGAGPRARARARPVQALRRLRGAAGGVPDAPPPQ